MSRHVSTRSLLALLVGVAIGWMLTGAAGLPFAVPPFSHQACVQGPAVVTEEFGSTIGVFNTPYLGTVSMFTLLHYPWMFSSGESIRVPASNTDFVTWLAMNWTLYPVHTQLLPGGGANAPCVSTWTASPTGLGLEGGGTGPLSSPYSAGENATQSDAQAPFEAYNSTYWMPLGFPISAFFNLNFSAPNSPEVNTCGEAETHLSEYSPEITLNFPFSWGSQHALASAELPVALWLNYTFPANAGVWQIDNLDLGPDPSGTGLAFVFSPCT